MLRNTFFPCKEKRKVHDTLHPLLLSYPIPTQSFVSIITKNQSTKFKTIFFLLYLILFLVIFSPLQFEATLHSLLLSCPLLLSAMKDTGKAIFKTYTNFPDFNCSAPQIPCSQHPYSIHIGICPHCLTDKLTKLLCFECGKNCVSSCSCSNRNSSSLFEVGSVGRLSFLIDNENIDTPSSNSKRKKRGSEKVAFLRRSSSSCAERKKKNGFWKLKGLFGKKRNKDNDENSEMSRSVSFSNAKISDVSRGSFFEYSNKQFGRVSNGMEIDRECNFPNRCVLPVKGKSDFSPLEDSEFIDLKLDSLSKSNQDFLYGGINGVSDHDNVYKNGNREIGGNIASLKSRWSLWKKGSCRGARSSNLGNEFFEKNK